MSLTELLYLEKTLSTSARVVYNRRLCDRPYNGASAGKELVRFRIKRDIYKQKNLRNFGPFVSIDSGKDSTVIFLDEPLSIFITLRKTVLSKSFIVTVIILN